MADQNAEAHAAIQASRQVPQITPAQRDAIGIKGD